MKFQVSNLRTPAGGLQETAEKLMGYLRNLHHNLRTYTPLVQLCDILILKVSGKLFGSRHLCKMRSSCGSDLAVNTCSTDEQCLYTNLTDKAAVDHDPIQGHVLARRTNYNEIVHGSFLGSTSET